MLNILYIAKDLSSFLNKNHFYLEQELSKISNLMIWRKSGNIKGIIEKLPVKPDFILMVNDIGIELNPVIEGLKSIQIPTGLFVNDIQRFTEKRREYIRKNNINYLFSVYRDKFKEVYPEFLNKMYWIPHHVNTNIYKDYKIKKEINYLMLGATNIDVYPLRNKILRYYQNNPEFVYRKHPGYVNRSKIEEKKQIIGENYAKWLNKSMVFFTCGSVFNYPVMKYYETLACRALLLAPTFKELEDLGFIPGVHFVPINEFDFNKKAYFYITNHKERKRITDQGYKFVHKNHSTETRANQLIQIISSTIKNSKH
ncbi:glycosyltransferase [Bacillus sp. FJAT-47783]|uniref:glycosyltransferase n=1 Tax=Bacillus sp. FJAT-47783 TaxID=2922712 RepID=UPI001FAE5494|nr:glycosyltransferase [Bacillus sp. FJAT-47783]